MAYRITDAHADPPGQTEALHTEKLVRMPEVAWCYRPPPCPDVGPLPARTAGRVTFGSLNNLAKVSAPVMALWSRVLQAVPGSRLLLQKGASKLAGERMRAEFARHGIDGGRLQLLDPLPQEDQYFRLFHEIDICLDPFPYNGCVTTCNSLWMGVPVIALAGNSYVSRQGVSLLANLHMHDWIAASPEEYVAIAVRWAEHLDSLEELRSGLRERMRVSPLRDEERFTRFLEAAFRRMWVDWCATAQEPVA
jgi:predicted O-linked N-acetylglucosamine transferase (SPINDLY family)